MQGLERTCLEMCAVDLTEVYSPPLFTERSMQLGLSTGVADDLETGCNLETKSRRDKCNNELRSARPKVLIASPPCPRFLTLQNHDVGSSIPLESGERKVITTRPHLRFAVRSCFEQMHRGYHFFLKHPSIASSWNEQCLQKLIAQPSVFRIEGPMCRWHLLSGENRCAREPSSWLTNHPDLADALDKWPESVSGVEPDGHVQVTT